MLKIERSKLYLLFLSVFLLSLFFTNCSADSFKLNSASNSSFELSVPLEKGEDPLFSYAWYFQNLGQIVFAQQGGTTGVDLNILPVWNQNIFGENVRVLISDTGVEETHEDIRSNFSLLAESKDYTLGSPYLSTTSPPRHANDNHGTPVASLVASPHNNSLGARGVASQSTLFSANFLSQNVAQTDAVFFDQIIGNYDITNMSWGIRQNTLGTRKLNWETLLKNQTETARGGLGKIYVKAAGNDFVVPCFGTTSTPCLGNAGFDPDSNTPYTINVGALNSKGTITSYSSPGSNIWVSSFGGELGSDSPATVAADRSGCSLGYARSASNSLVAFQRGQNGNTNCNYTATFNGTSAAAPLVSGAIALMLQVRPTLSWRDIKYILAISSQRPSYQTVTPISHPLGEPVPAGYQWEQPWVVNGAGIPFHNWYGFGRIDINSAISMAQTYVSPFGPYTETNWSHDAQGLNVTIPDFSAAGVTSTMSVTQTLKAESVQLRIWITHPDVSELAIELTSPLGTKSIIVNGRNALTGLPNFLGELFLSNAFYRENIQGLWTLRVVDLKTGSAAGSLTRWSLNFSGSP